MDLSNSTIDGKVILFQDDVMPGDRINISNIRIEEFGKVVLLFERNDKFYKELLNEAGSGNEHLT